MPEDNHSEPSTDLTAKQRYNRDWWAANPEKRSIYNRTCVRVGRERFQSGERQRAAEKRCPTCQLTKPAMDFYLSNTSKDGLHGCCKPCSDQRTTDNARKRLGVDPKRYRTMWEEQSGRCAICGISEADCGKVLRVDHDHQTGKIRALLCNRCNLVLGNVDDDASILRSGADYLDQHHSTTDNASLPIPTTCVTPDD